MLKKPPDDIQFYDPSINEVFMDWVINHDPDFPGDPVELTDSFNWFIIPLVTDTFVEKVVEYDLQRDRTSQLALLATMIDDWYRQDEHILIGIANIFTECLEAHRIPFHTKLQLLMPSLNIGNLSFHELRRNHDHLRTHRKSRDFRHLCSSAHWRGLQTL